MASGDDDLQLEVIDNPEENRYEGYIDGGLAGFVEYDAEPGRLVLLHTEVDDAFEGRGVGSRLAAAVLDDIRGRELTIVARCPFISRYLESHPEYRDLEAETA
jgi:predicted GNAT family acetyltransferase